MLREFGVDIKLANPEEDKSKTSDVSWVADFNWHRVAGCRYAHVTKLTAEADLQPKTLLFAVVVAVFRYLTDWALETTDGSADGGCCSFPPLLDLVTARLSPVTICQQYLHGLFNGDAQDRLFSVSVFSQCSRADFVAGRHSLSLTARSSVQAASAWLFYRNMVYEDAPFTLARYSDSRLSEQELDETTEDLHGRRLCCLDPASTRKIRRRMTHEG